MFDFLKKKISNFVEKISTSAKALVSESQSSDSVLITGTAEKKEEKIEEKPVEAQKPKEAEITLPKPAAPAQLEVVKEEHVKPQLPILTEKKTESKREEKQEVNHEKHVEPIVPQVATKPIDELRPKPEIKLEQKPELKIEKKQEATQEKSFMPHLGIFKKIASVFTPEVELSEKEVAEVFDDLELSLLESDASLDTSQYMVADLRSKVVGKRIQKSKLNEFVNSTVRSVLLDVFSLSNPQQSFFSLIEQHKNSAKGPFVILFVGPNGAGKTTTIAKIAHHLKARNISSVISASDTFRAAAIQQAEHHGEKIGVKVVKHDYGSDPAAVAFDAVSHAKAKNLDVVLIDTAGRQETNVNLIEEMKKISRVVKPDLKIFIGETLAGHSVIEQAKKFNEAIKLDGLILTKLDCDAKGGNALSIAHDLKLPIYFVGLGQEYSDLVEFTPQMLVSRILAE